MAKHRVTNEYFKDGGNTYLKIVTTKNEQVFFIIDEHNVELMKNYLWYAMYCPHRKQHYLESSNKTKLHRLIMNTLSNLVVDHINRFTYDNREENLRNCTVTENSQNIRRPKFQTNPKQSKLGIPYISIKDNGQGKIYYDVRYRGHPRKHFKTLKEAKEYLNKIKQEKF